MTSAPSLIDQLLQWVREKRAQLDALELAVQNVRDLDGSAGPVVPPPAAPVRAATPPAPRPVAVRQTPRQEGLAATIGAFLDKQKRPVTMAAVVSASGSYAGKVRQILDEMAAAGTLVRTGTRYSLRLGRPSVMSAENTEED